MARHLAHVPSTCFHCWYFSWDQNKLTNFSGHPGRLDEWSNRHKHSKTTKFVSKSCDKNSWDCEILWISLFTHQTQFGRPSPSETAFETPGSGIRRGIDPSSYGSLWSKALTAPLIILGLLMFSWRRRCTIGRDGYCVASPRI